MSQSDLLARIGAAHNDQRGRLERERGAIANDRALLAQGLASITAYVDEMAAHLGAQFEARLARIDRALIELGPAFPALSDATAGETEQRAGRHLNVVSNQ